MKRIIKFLKLFSLLIIIGTYTISAQSIYERIDEYKQFRQKIIKHTGENSDLKTDVTESGNRTLFQRTENGRDKMCLALDIQKVRAKIISALENEALMPDLIDSIDLMLFHLRGTAEGEKLNILIKDPTATAEDYERIINEIEKSLNNRLTGEEKWAFETGLSLAEIYIQEYFGTERGLKNALRKLGSLAGFADFVTESEIEILKNVSQFADQDEISSEDYLNIEIKLGDFLKSYFKTL